MPGSEAELRELDELRHKLTEYEAALRSAAPRLAAFKRLEQLARAKGSTPEAVAEQAALEVLKREKDALVTLLAGLANERDQLKGETAMLLINKTEASKAVEALTGRHDELNVEVAELVDRLTEIRRDAVRLMSHRSQLAVEVSALRDEAQALQEAIDHANRAIAFNDASRMDAVRTDAADEHRNPGRRAEDAAPVGEPVSFDELADPFADDGSAVVAPQPVDPSAVHDPVTVTDHDPAVVNDPVVVHDPAVVSDGVPEARSDVAHPNDESCGEPAGALSHEAEVLAAELEQNKADRKRRQGLDSRRTVATSIEADEETEQLESQAFDAFFHAEIDHDKSRDWILG